MKTGIVIVMLAVVGLLSCISATRAEATSGPAYSVSVTCKKPATGSRPVMGVRKVSCSGATAYALVRANRGVAVVKTCVVFPDNSRTCTSVMADKGIPYSNKVRIGEHGSYQISWFVKGKKVGTASVIKTKPRQTLAALASASRSKCVDVAAGGGGPTCQRARCVDVAAGGGGPTCS